jgi:predicted oxidoreductase (fatty acid repression mutant protein)
MKMVHELQQAPGSRPLRSINPENRSSEAVKHVSSSFNLQSARVAVFLKGQHQRLWSR